MKKLIWLGALVAACAAFGAKPKADKVDMPLPRDTQILTVGKGGPIKTLEAALEQVARFRNGNKKRPIAIRLEPGDYAIEKSLVLTPAHAATNMAPLYIYAADFSRKPRLHGGAFVTGWKKTTFNGRKDVWVADASKLHPSEDRSLLRLTFNGTRLTAARYPNVDPHYPYTTGYASASTNRPSFYADELKMRPEETRTWAHPEDGVMIVCPQHSFDWKVSGVVGLEKDVIRLKQKHDEQKGSWKWDRWCIQNVAEELDEAGEWYHDPREKKIYLLTPDGSDPNAAVVTLEHTEAIFKIEKGSGNCTLAGLDLAGGKDGVNIDKADDVRLWGCAIHDIGGFGLYGGTAVWILGFRTEVKDCDIYRTGTHGIVVHSHWDARFFDSRQDINIENNYFHHCGELNPDGGAIFNCGQGVKIRGNLMHDMPRAALYGYGHFCDIAFNRVRHVNTRSSDTGAFYDSGWPAGAGSKIRYNWITDSIGYRRLGPGRYRHNENACGIYFDECSGGTEVYGNLVANCHWTAVMMHNARWVTVSNNVFVSNGWIPVWHYTHQIEISSWEKKGFQTPSRRRTYMDGWKSVVEQDERWRTLPSLAQDPYTDEVFSSDGSMVMGIKIVNNIISYPDQEQGVLLYGYHVNMTTNLFDNNFYQVGKSKVMRSATRVYEREDISWKAWLEEKGQDRNSVIGNPQFVDPKKGDYRLKPTSPAFKLGFKELPYDRMGLRVTRFRPILPKEAEGLREHPEWLIDEKGNHLKKNGSRVESPNVRR